MTAEKKVILIIVITFIVAAVFGMLVQKKLHVCKEAPCKLDSLVSVISQKDSITSLYKDSIRISEMSRQMMKESYEYQKKILKDEISNLNDSSRLLFFKNYCSEHGLNPALVRFDHK